MAGLVAALALSLAIAYLAGAVPVAYVVGRVTRGIDIREHGSGNVGATNAYRVLGPAPGAIVLVLDAAKGALAVYAGTLAFTGALSLLAPATDVGELTDRATAWLPVLCGLAAILGHTYTPFLGFKGGKGIATAAGVLLVITPWAVAILLAVFAAVVALTRLVSLGSVVIAVMYPALVRLLYPDVPGALPFAVLAAALVVWRHRGNIARIARGEERRVTWGREAGGGGGRG